MKLTARTRLTAVYTLVVLVAGLAMTALTYVLLQRGMGRRLSIIIIGPVGGDLPEPPDIGDQLQNATLSEFLAMAAIAIVIVTVLAALVGWLVAGRVLRPIRTISAAAQRLSVENLSERVPVAPPADELATLAGTINGMLDRIQRGIAERDRVLASQRMFTANAAHELRTPLTTMRAAIDVTLDGQPTVAELVTMAGDVRTAVEQSQRTLDGLLVLARSQAGSGVRDRVDLADILAKMLGDTGDLLLRLDLRPAPVAGDPILLERMASNLVENAIRHNRDGGEIEASTGVEESRTFLRISNTGARVDDVHRLLEPFVRGEGARIHTDAGVGLGLSIVRAIVVAHGGDIRTQARPGGGLAVVILFDADV